jgi:16S rRNA (uracil1498-N3)-methyltransferase
VPQLPQVAIVLPLLERDALEEVVYMATVYGVHDIHLVVTEKSRKILTEKEHARLHKIAIAAGEQSKQFFMPKIHVVSPLEDFIQKQSYKSSLKLWCDISGESILKLKERSRSEDGYLLIWGPEGDFAHQEKEMLGKLFIPVKLANAVLRARDAAALIMGIIRL